MKRRKFLKTGFTALSSTLAFTLSSCSRKRRPNILIFITDHSAQKAIGAYGNTLAQTPNIDSLAEQGVRFSKAYTACPLCQPARAAFWTSHFSHQTQVRSNESAERIPQEMTTLGDLFSAAGYNCYHSGKTHDAGSLRGFCVENYGEKKRQNDEWSRYYNYDTNRDEYHTPLMLDFLQAEHEKPFLAVLDLHNPHNICNYCGVNRDHTDEENLPHIPEKQLPPLPDNFEIEDLQSRPLPVQYLCCTHPRLWQAARWSERNYRHYIAAFNHFQKLADEKIGLCLQALRDFGEFDNTLIVYFADHGDGLANHRMVTKHLSFYEETTRIPFIFSGPGVQLKDHLVEQALVSTLDLLPTLCEYADIEHPTAIEGRSLLDCFTNKNATVDRKFIVSEWHKEYDKVSSHSLYIKDRAQCTSPGRMLRSDRFKYMHYLEGDGEELYDLQKDPSEKVNLAYQEAFAAELQKHRDMLAQHIKKTGDDYFSLKVDVDPGFRRRHFLGYQNHFHKG